LPDLDDLLRSRLAALKAERDRAQAALERAKASQCPKFKLIRPWSKRCGPYDEAEPHRRLGARDDSLNH
jgi:hypothetical protein